MFIVAVNVWWIKSILYCTHFVTPILIGWHNQHTGQTLPNIYCILFMKIIPTGGGGGGLAVWRLSNQYYIQLRTTIEHYSLKNKLDECNPRIYRKYKHISLFSKFSNDWYRKPNDCKMNSFFHITNDNSLKTQFRDGHVLLMLLIVVKKDNKAFSTSSVKNTRQSSFWRKDLIKHRHETLAFCM